MIKPKYVKAEIDAVKAFHAGKANPHQQNIVKALIIEKLCGVYNQSFTADNTHLTAFNEGKRWVGGELRDLITLGYDQLLEEPTEDERSTGGSLTSARSKRTTTTSGTNPATKRKRSRVKSTV